MNNKQFTLIIATAILLLSSLDVMAAWVLYADMDGGQGYFEPKTIKWISKTKVNVLTYINLPEDKFSYAPENGKKVIFSNKVLQQYDCKALTYDFLETELYSDYNLKGDIVKRNKREKREPRAIDEGSPAENLVTILCNKKGRS